MTSNQSKSIKNVVSLLCMQRKCTVYRDTTALIDLLDVMSCTTPACFSTFFRSSYYCPYST